MQVYKNDDFELISVLMPAGLRALDHTLGSAVIDLAHVARFCGYNLYFSPSTQRSSELSKYIVGYNEKIKTYIMPQYGWTLEQEISNLRGTVIIPDENTSAADLKVEIGALLSPGMDTNGIKPNKIGSMPFYVEKVNDDEYVLIGGIHRMQAVITLGHDEVPVVVSGGSGNIESIKISKIKV